LGNFTVPPLVTEVPIRPWGLRLSNPTDMTIQWKALEENFLMQLLVLRFNHFGECTFWIFHRKTQS
jgi:hypothetical protein